MHSGPRYYMGDEWSASNPGRFIPGKEPWFPLDRRVGGPQGQSGSGGDI
jgi:hypothetical protein